MKTEHESCQIAERDILRARFTRWLETAVMHARTNYLRKLGRQIETVSFEELGEGAVVEESVEEALRDAFAFEEERIAYAFASLPIKRQEILTMLFVEEKTPSAIAKQLNCSVQHVYNQRSLALKKLRNTLLLQEGQE